MKKEKYLFKFSDESKGDQYNRVLEKLRKWEKGVPANFYPNLNIS